MQFVRPQVQGCHDGKVKQRRSCVPKLKSNAMQHCAMLTKHSAPTYASCSILHRSVFTLSLQVEKTRFEGVWQIL